MFPRALKNRDDAFWMLEKAVDALALRPGSPSGPPGLKPHVLKKPGSGSDQLVNSLLSYVSGLGEQVSSRFTLEIQPFDLVP
jgi:hypothetical protein